MKEATGNLWTVPASWRCVTTNGIVKDNGELVMGAGVALEAKKQYPDLPKKLGQWVEKYGNRPFLCRDEGIITFPTKQHYKHNSNVMLIRSSAEKIVAIADKYKLHSIVLPRPGCGNGGLTWDFVKPYLEDLLDERFTIITEGVCG